MKVGRGTVRAYLEGLRGISIVSGATEHTYREPLVTFLVAASKDLGLGRVGVHGNFVSRPLASQTCKWSTRRLDA